MPGGKLIFDLAPAIHDNENNQDIESHIRLRRFGKQIQFRWPTPKWMFEICSADSVRLTFNEEDDGCRLISSNSLFPESHRKFRVRPINRK